MDCRTWTADVDCERGFNDGDKDRYVDMKSVKLLNSGKFLKMETPSFVELAIVVINHDEEDVFNEDDTSVIEYDNSGEEKEKKEEEEDEEEE